MSIYDFAPTPTPVLNHFAFWRDGFSPEEIRSIVSHGDSLAAAKATTEGDQSDSIRKSQTAWIGRSDETEWLYERLSGISRKLNAEFFHLDLKGFHEDFQFTTYGSDQDHYTWHVDHGSHPFRPPRKLSLVLQLSDPYEYEGGDLQMQTGSEPFTVEKQKGLLYAFPSYVLHRVTPVTAGIRKTLVVWISGPAFR